MLVLTALLRLRQACCDLRLLGLQPDAAASSADLADEGDEEPTTSATRPVRPAAVSAKLTLLDELLTEEVREGGHRVLIFSQFVSMLKILSAHLEAGRGPPSATWTVRPNRANAPRRWSVSRPTRASRRF